MVSVMVTNTEKSVRDVDTRTQTQLQGQSHKTAYRVGTDSDSRQRTKWHRECKSGLCSWLNDIKKFLDPYHSPPRSPLMGHPSLLVTLSWSPKHENGEPRQARRAFHLGHQNVSRSTSQRDRSLRKYVGLEVWQAMKAKTEFDRQHPHQNPGTFL